MDRQLRWEGAWGEWARKLDIPGSGQAAGLEGKCWDPGRVHLPLATVPGSISPHGTDTSTPGSPQPQVVQTPQPTAPLIPTRLAPPSSPHVSEHLSRLPPAPRVGNPLPPP